MAFSPVYTLPMHSIFRCQTISFTRRVCFCLTHQVFKCIALSGTEPVVNKDSRDQPDTSLSLCLLPKALHSLARQYFSFSRATNTPLSAPLLTGLAHPDTELLAMLVPSIPSSLEDAERLLKQKFCGGWSC